MFYGGIHVQPLEFRLFAADNHIDVIAAAQAMIGYRQQSVGIRREINTDHLRLLVDNVVNETRILMAESIVILPPDQRTKQVIQVRQWAAARNVPRHLQPFGVLVEHRINDVNERLVAGKKSVPARSAGSLRANLRIGARSTFPSRGHRARHARRSQGFPPSSTRLVTSKAAPQRFEAVSSGLKTRKFS